MHWWEGCKHLYMMGDSALQNWLCLVVDTAICCNRICTLWVRAEVENAFTVNCNFQFPNCYVAQMNCYCTPSCLICDPTVSFRGLTYEAAEIAWTLLESLARQTQLSFVFSWLAVPSLPRRLAWSTVLPQTMVDLFKQTIAGCSFSKVVWTSQEALVPPALHLLAG